MLRRTPGILVGFAIVGMLCAVAAFGQSRPPLPNYEPNDSLGTAYGPVEDGRDYRSYLLHGFDVDWFRFVATAGKSVTVTVYNGGTGPQSVCDSLEASVVDQQGRSLGSAKITGFGSSSQIGITAPSRASFFVGIAAVDHCEDDYDYVVRVDGALSSRAVCVPVERSLRKHRRRLSRYRARLRAAEDRSTRGRLRRAVSREGRKLRQLTEAQRDVCPAILPRP